MVIFGHLGDLHEAKILWFKKTKSKWRKRQRKTITRPNREETGAVHQKTDEKNRHRVDSLLLSFFFYCIVLYSILNGVHSEYLILYAMYIQLALAEITFVRNKQRYGRAKNGSHTNNWCPRHKYRFSRAIIIFSVSIYEYFFSLFILCCGCLCKK